MTATLTLRDTVAVLDLGDGENRFSPDWLDTVDGLLDEIADTAHALVTTATGKFFSNGLDLEWLTANGDRAEWYLERVHGLFGRVLTFPLPTVAAVNGHAFGAGAMLGMAHDYRVMRADRGFYCFPEVDIRIPFTPGMAALIQAKLTPQTAVTAMTTGHRYGGTEAQSVGLVDRAVPDDVLVETAVEIVTPLLGKDSGTLGAIKSTMFSTAVEKLGVGRA